MEVWRFHPETSECWLANNDYLKCHGSTYNFEFGILSALGSCWEVRRQHCSGSFRDPEESWNSVPCMKSPSPVFSLPSSKYSPVCRGIHNLARIWSVGLWALFIQGQRSGLWGAPSPGGSGVAETICGTWSSNNNPHHTLPPKAGGMFGLHRYLVTSGSGHFIAILLPLFSAVVVQENRAYTIHIYHPWRSVQCLRLPITNTQIWTKALLFLWNLRNR